MSKRKLPTIITEEELKKLIKAAKKKEHKLALLFGFYQCLRISELAGLGKEISSCCRAEINKNKESVEGKDRKIIVRRCTGCGKELKLSEIRRHPSDWQIHPLSSDDIENGFIKLKNAKGGFDRNIPVAPEVSRYCSGFPLSIKSRALEIMINQLGKKVLGKDLHYHCLRHSGATFYLNEKKWNIRLVQQFLGHSNLQTTQVYTHVNPDDLFKAMNG